MRTLIVLLVVCAFSCSAQRNQLLMFKGDNLIFRFKVGDDFVVRLKNSKEIKRSFIVEISDSIVITGYDTIPIYRIDKVYKTRTTLLNVVGAVMMIGGIGYFVIDQFNVVVVNGDKPNIDHGVAVSSAVLTGGGALLYYIRKKKQRIRGRWRLLSVDNKSSLYLPDYVPQKGYISPYIPRN